MKRFLCLAVLLVMLVPLTAQAASVVKFSFNDVLLPDGTIGEIEAGSKTTNKATFTTCSYFSDDYLTYLGYYESSEFASDDAAAVLQFCLEHYEDRDAH